MGEQIQSLDMGCDGGVCGDDPGRTASRREFLRTAGCFGMVLAACGLGRIDAAALPVAMTNSPKIHPRLVKLRICSSCSNNFFYRRTSGTEL